MRKDLLESVLPDGNVFWSILSMKHSFTKKIEFWFTAKFVISLVGLILFISSLLLNLKAQQEQDESRQLLLQIYQTLYSYKIENGEFPNTSTKIFPVPQLEDLKPYIKNKNNFNRIKNTQLYLVSSHDRFNIILEKKLVNGEKDVQILNSKKEFCHKHNGINHHSRNCTDTSFSTASFG